MPGTFIPCGSRVLVYRGDDADSGSFLKSRPFLKDPQNSKAPDKKSDPKGDPNVEDYPFRGLGFRGWELRV